MKERRKRADEETRNTSQGAGHFTRGTVRGAQKAKVAPQHGAGNTRSEHTQRENDAQADAQTQAVEEDDEQNTKTSEYILSSESSHVSRDEVGGEGVITLYVWREHALTGVTNVALLNNQIIHILPFPPNPDIPIAMAM